MRKLAVALFATSLATVAACTTPPADVPDTGADDTGLGDGGGRDSGRDAGRDTGADTGVAMMDGGDDAATDDAATDDAATDDAAMDDGGCTSDTACDDGDACTTDTCTAGACSHAPISGIDDGDACTTDACDTSAGTITHTPLTAIDDGNACTMDQCDSSSGAITHPPLASIDDSDVCTTDACDTSGAVSHTPVTNCCHGASDCTSGVCSSNVCVPAQCTDGVQNGAETAIDCGGGTCAPCTVGQGCGADSDCDTSACSGSVCVECNAATDCPGTDTDCHMRTCTSHTCGVNNVVSGTATSSQTGGDCRVNQCDGAGAIVNVADDSDVPADDGQQCTSDVCTSGAPSHPPLASGTTCSQGGGAVCNGAGACVECLTASTCPGTDTECAMRTCTSNTCGFSFQPSGTATSSQTPGDCHQNQCDGAGNLANAVFDADVPDDGMQCTDDLCSSGTPSHTPVSMGTACTEGGGTECDGSGMCVQCLAPSDCPGVDNACQTRTCVVGACGFSYQPSGTVVVSTVGDCHANQCDGSGAIVSVVDDTDVPDDGNECTTDACNTGAPANTPKALGTACTQDGGVECNGAGACGTPPTVTGTSPADGVSVAAGTSIAVTFSEAMDGTTLTAQTSAGACTGSVQVSLDDFATCIAFSSAAPVMSGGGTVATFTAAPGELINRTYKIRVTTAAESALAFPLTSAFTQTSGFTTVGSGICGASSVVIAQVYGGGGNSGAIFRNDFVVLHNRGTSPVSIGGWAIQYGSRNGTSWTANAIPAGSTIAAGGYFLLQGPSGGANGVVLPTADATFTSDMAAAGGKVVLTNTTTALAAGACPSGGTVVDFVGYGTGSSSTNCFEGTTAAPTLSSALTGLRAVDCADNNDNGAEFVTATTAPLNSSTVSGCGCVWNESADASEADYCVIQFPTSIDVMTGVATPLVYGRIFEAGTTEAAGAPANVVAQVGYGSGSVNPEYQSGWTWTNATYNVQVGNDDEFQASFTAPAAGTYAYGYRFSLDNGASWTYCDTNGAGSNTGLSFDLSNLPVLTVTP